MVIGTDSVINHETNMGHARSIPKNAQKDNQDHTEEVEQKRALDKIDGEIAILSAKPNPSQEVLDAIRNLQGLRTQVRHGNVKGADALRQISTIENGVRHEQFAEAREDSQEFNRALAKMDKETQKQYAALSKEAQKTIQEVHEILSKPEPLTGKERIAVIHKVTGDLETASTEEELRIAADLDEAHPGIIDGWKDKPDEIAEIQIEVLHNKDEAKKIEDKQSNKEMRRRVKTVNRVTPIHTGQSLKELEEATHDSKKMDALEDKLKCKIEADMPGYLKRFGCKLGEKQLQSIKTLTAEQSVNVLFDVLNDEKRFKAALDYNQNPSKFPNPSNDLLRDAGLLGINNYMMKEGQLLYTDRMSEISLKKKQGVALTENEAQIAKLYDQAASKNLTEAEALANNKQIYGLIDAQLTAQNQQKDLNKAATTSPIKVPAENDYAAWENLYDAPDAKAEREKNKDGSDSNNGEAKKFCTVARLNQAMTIAKLTKLQST